MSNGKAVVDEGSAAADGNAAGSCEYTGTLSLETVPDDGAAHDLFLNFVASEKATYLLDHFWLRANESCGEKCNKKEIRHRGET